MTCTPKFHLETTGKRSLGKPTRKWENIVKVGLRKVGHVDGRWMEVA
jgi:hypothetical protein